MTGAARVLAVATANLVLAAALFRLVSEPVEIAPLPPPDRHALVVADGTADAEAERPHLSELDRNHVIARPLFAPDRRPWQPPPEPEPLAVAVADAGPDPEAELALLGIAVAGGRARALLMPVAGGEPVWAVEGDTVWDWRVSAISARSVTIERATGALSLRLYPAEAGE